MGRRGPKKTPTKILKDRGSWLVDRRGPEPETLPGRPPTPTFDRPESVKIWHRLLDLLDEMGIIGQTDGNALERYCNALAKYRECESILADKGLTYEKETRDGHTSIKRRPETALQKEYSEECRKLEMMFGLTPASRAELAPIRHSDPNENRGKKKTKAKSRFFAAG